MHVCVCGGDCIVIYDIRELAGARIMWGFAGHGMDLDFALSETGGPGGY